MCVEKGFDAELIARAKQALPWRVPDGEDEIAEEMIDALLAPDLIRAQDQLRVGGCRQFFVALGAKPGPEIVARVHAGVGDDPSLAVPCEGLILLRGFVGGAQQGVTEADGAGGPDLLRVRASKR